MANQLILTIRPDYKGTGIFSDKGEVINYTDLSLPDEIKTAFESWINWYWDSFYDPEDFASDAFEARGLEISRQLKQFLKDSATVVYQGMKIKCDENNFQEAERNDISYLLAKINEIDKRMDKISVDEKLLEEYRQTRNSLCEAIFNEVYKSLPSLLRIGDFEIKDTGILKDNEIIEQYWSNFTENALDFVDNCGGLDPHADKTIIEEKIRKHFCDEQEIDLDEEELFITYPDKVQEYLEELESGLENLWSEFSLNYSHIPEGRSMLITALHSNYVFDIEGLHYLYTLLEKYMPGYLSPMEKVKKAEEIVIQAHFNQPYGDHKENGDYYKYHLDVVRKIALRLAKKHSDLHTYKFEIAALLHDYLEDTRPTGKDIGNLVQLFGEQMLQSIEKLTYRHDRGYDEYFEAISEDEVAKIVKTADRIANISALKDVQSIEKRKKLFHKYFGQFELFDRFEIFPEEIEEAFFSLIL